MSLILHAPMNMRSKTLRGCKLLMIHVMLIRIWRRTHRDGLMLRGTLLIGQKVNNQGSGGTALLGLILLVPQMQNVPMEPLT